MSLQKVENPTLQIKKHNLADASLQPTKRAIKSMANSRARIRHATLGRQRALPASFSKNNPNGIRYLISHHKRLRYQPSTGDLLDRASCYSPRISRRKCT